MLFNAITLLSASALAAPAILKREEAATSGPFKLKVVSDNSTINGGTITPVHAGAGIEALSVGGVGTDPSGWSDYYFNQTTYASEEYPQGAVYWNLPINGGEQEPSAMQIEYTPYTSLVPIELLPGAAADYEDNYFGLAFDNEGYLGTPGPKRAERWYACTQEVGSGYSYYSVAWSTDDRKPQNPTCSAIRLQKLEL